MRRHDLTNKKAMTKTNTLTKTMTKKITKKMTMTIEEHPQRTILETRDL